MLRARALLGVVAAAAVSTAALYGCGTGTDIEIAGASGTMAGPGSGGAGGTAGANVGGSGAGGKGGDATSAGGGGSGPSECAAASDCDKLFGAAPCGAWACNAGACEAQSTGCTDADQDGYGTGAACACAGLDCDDGDDKIGDKGTRACYSGPGGSQGQGTCHEGVEMCSAGAWGPCVGEITPSGEACNSQDDDCNGAIDDNLGNFNCGIGTCAASVPACTNGMVGVCTPGQAAALDGPTCDMMDNDCDGAIDEDCNNCVYVTLNGNDGNGSGTLAQPFLTVQAAITYAAANNKPNVCVAAGLLCGTAATPVTGTYANGAGQTVTMANGVSVLGNYESTAGTRCANNTTTVLQPKVPEGVVFPNTVTKPTVLDGFRVDRFTAGTTAGITVDGAKGAFISSVAITNTPQIASSYGVDIKNGGDVTITKSRIEGGIGSAESIGVRCMGSKVKIDNNCLTIDAAGHCSTGCGNNNPSIRGRVQNGTGTSYGILIQDSPGSSVETSAVCVIAGADQGAALRIGGDGTGLLVRANNIVSVNQQLQSYGVQAEECNDAAPWIVDNHLIQAGGANNMTVVDAVRAIGACHPVIDSNERIVGGGEGMTANTTGVHCGANANGVASQCVVLGNKLIQGSVAGFPPTATGVRCDNGGCMRIANNLITGRGGMDSFGITLQSTGTVVDNNTIRGGCASNSATGIFATDVYSRVQNNRIFGFSVTDCAAGNPPPMATKLSVGMRAIVAPGQNEIDVHSNDIIGGDATVACTSAGVALDVGLVAPASGSGIFRNNIILPGTCMNARTNFAELALGADPRIFENNNLDPQGNPVALYLDEAASGLATSAAVDGLVDMTVQGTLSAGSLFVNFPTDLHIQLMSPCNGAGTPAGVPAVDMDGDPRDMLMPDIGTDER